jgi:predicted transport protein
MDKSLNTMLENLSSKTGHALDEWKEIIAPLNLSKHGEIVRFLKEVHGVTHGYATTIASKVLGSDAASAENLEDLVTAQYKGKAHLRAFYDKLITEIGKFDGDFEIAPKKAYVSLRRKKQFLTLRPASQSRFEIGLHLKGIGAKGKLEAEKPMSMCSHKINLAHLQDLDKEVMDWVQLAYEQAGG